MSRLIDFRSDTVTQPDAEMRRVMAEAKVGDDVWGDDPTALELEEHTADLLGKEAAVYCPSGTMANLLASTVHCQGIFSELIVPHDSHVSRYEVGNTVLARGHCRQVISAEDGTLPLESLQAVIQEIDIHNTITRVIYLENTHNDRGGKVLPLSYLASVRKLADSKQVKLHCDGARLWHASTALKVPPSTIAAHFDSVSVCCSKGLGAPVGSLLAGPKDFIAQARQARKMYGGGMRQVGIIAAGALFAIKHRYQRLEEDHAWCNQLATAIGETGLSVIPPQSNILLWTIPGKGETSATANRDTFLTKCEAQGLQLCAIAQDRVRAIPHFGNTDADIVDATKIIRQVVSEMQLM